MELNVTSEYDDEVNLWFASIVRDDEVKISFSHRDEDEAIDALVTWSFTGEIPEDALVISLGKKIIYALACD